MRKSLNLKINLMMVVVVTIFFSSFGIFDYLEKSTARTKELNSDILFTINRLVKTLERPIWSFDYKDMLVPVLAEMRSKSIKSIVIYDSTTKLILGKTRDSLWNIIDVTRPLKDIEYQINRDITHNQKKIASIKLQYTKHIIEAEIISEAVLQIQRVILLIFIFTIMLSISIYLAILKPINTLAESVRVISKTDINKSIDTRRKDELGDLAVDISSLRNTIKQKINALNLEIIDRKKVSNELKVSEEKFRTLFETSRDAIVLLDPHNGYIDCNDTAYKMFGVLSRDDFLNLTPINLSPEYQLNGILSKTELEKHIKITLEEGSHFFEWTYKRIEGLSFPATVLTNKIELGGKILIQGTIRNITESKLAEEALKNAQNYITNIINSMPSILISVDQKGVITQWNKKAEEISGISLNKAVGQLLSQVLPIPGTEMAKVRKAMETQEVMIEPKRLRLKDNKTIFEDVTIYPLIAKGVDGAVIRIDDVTEQVRLEEMMVQSEKMLSIGGLAAGMAHEINNPLAGMIQTANVMKNRLNYDNIIPANLKAAEAAGTTMQNIASFMDARGIPRMIQTINDSGKRVASIVDNMLSFASKSNSGSALHDMVEILDKTLELATTDYNLKKDYDFKTIEIVKKYSANIPPINCELSKIQQVFLNIFRNGAQAMQEKSTEPMQFIIRVFLNKNKQYLVTEIEDNGSGMNDDVRRRVFEPFFTTKPVGVGTGLGLSVSYFIITENHGGKISVESKPGIGSKFNIHLPV